MDKEKSFLINRFKELANISFNKDIYTFTDFLNLNEISILKSIENELPPVKMTLSGGNLYAERKIACFNPVDINYEQDFPISVIKISPLSRKFTDKLTHRDYLGALLNLGLDRTKIGDIFVLDLDAYIYVIDDLASYIAENLTRVKHTNVKCVLCEKLTIDIKPNLKEITGNVASVRLDSLISTAFGSSRNSIIPLISGAKVFVNGKLITSNGYELKPADIVSVRGKGRFIFNKILGTSKKGRYIVSISLFF